MNFIDYQFKGGGRSHWSPYIKQYFTGNAFNLGKLGISRYGPADMPSISSQIVVDYTMSLNSGNK